MDTFSREDITRLVGAITTLATARTRDDVIAVVRDSARALVGCDGVTFVLREGPEVFYVDEDAIAPLWKGQRFPASACISGWVTTHREAVIIEDIYADARVPAEAYRPTFVKSLAMVAINRDAPVGAVGAYWAKPHKAKLRQLDLLQALADASATALTNAELARNMDTARADLARASSAKNDFLALLGHELRNPLAPIVTAIKLLKLKGTTPPRELGVIERQSQHLIRLVDDLLDVSRLTRGKVDIMRRRLRAAAVVAHAQQSVQPLFDERGVQVSTRLDFDVMIEGDEGRLTQIVVNLLTNAAKFTPAGGSVFIDGAREGGSFTLKVRDTGVGLSAELLARLFEPFVQGPQPIDRAQGGLGLGLAVARTLVELHGGSLHAESAGPGHGSTFTLKVPLPADIPAIAKTPPPTVTDDQDARGKPRRILVVDDNKDAADLLAAVLTTEGHSVAVAFDPEDAQKHAGEHDVDIAILDIGLPLMDGYELAAALRRDLGARCPRLIALTGYGEQRDRDRSAAAGFETHLVKPVGYDQLMRAVRAVS